MAINTQFETSTTTDLPTSRSPTKKPRELQKLNEALAKVAQVTQRPRPTPSIAAHIDSLPPPPSPQGGYKRPLPFPFLNNPEASSPTKKSKLQEAPPPTPRKIPIVKVRSPYETLHKDLTGGYLTRPTQEMFRVQQIAQGSYSNVYRIEGLHSLIPSIPNENLVLKAFHGGNKSGFNEKSLNSFIKNASQNYRQACNLNLPIAKIYNLEEALSDHFFIQEYIASSVDVSNAEQMRQVKLFFDISLGAGVMFDLIPANFRVREGGTVVLIDFIEEDDDSVFMNDLIKKWNTFLCEAGLEKEAVSTIMKNLTAGFPDSNKIWLTEILESAKPLI